jgi:hypothetical protein
VRSKDYMMQATYLCISVAFSRGLLGLRSLLRGALGGDGDYVMVHVQLDIALRHPWNVSFDLKTVSVLQSKHHQSRLKLLSETVQIGGSSISGL